MNYAYTAIINERSYGIGRADKGIPGYTPFPKAGTFKTYEEASEFAADLNEKNGLDKLEAYKIVASTM